MRGEEERKGGRGREGEVRGSARRPGARKQAVQEGPGCTQVSQMGTGETMESHCEDEPHTHSPSALSAARFSMSSVSRLRDHEVASRSDLAGSDSQRGV